MTRRSVFGLSLVVLLSGCNSKDKAVLTGKDDTVDTFHFQPRTAEEMSAPAATASAAPVVSTPPKSAIDDFKFKPKTAAEMSAPLPKSPSATPAAIDTFVFVPRSAAQMASTPRRK